MEKSDAEVHIGGLNVENTEKILVSLLEVSQLAIHAAFGVSRQLLVLDVRLNHVDIL
jgi:hypothetical protein